MDYSAIQECKDWKHSPFRISQWLRVLEKRVLLRPAVYILIMTVLGGYLGFYGSPGVRILGSIGVAGAEVLLSWKKRFQKCTLLFLAGTAAFGLFFLGFSIWSDHARQLQPTSHYRGNAVVCSSNSYQEGFKNVILRLDSGERVTFLTDRQLKYGARLEIDGELMKIMPSGNPGDMNLSKYYRKQGILRSIESVSVTEMSTRTFHPICLMYRLGAYLSQEAHEFWLDYMDEHSAGFLSAMISGNDSYLTREEKEYFVSGNLSHLLVVSGAHVAYFTATMTALITIFTQDTKKRMCLLFLALLMFGFVCGWGGSVTRSIIMYILISCISVQNRTADRLSICAFSALCMIALDPFAMFSNGILLSFGATMSISLWMTRTKERLKRYCFNLPDEILCAIACCICAQIGMLPVLVLLGSSISVLSALNIVIAGFPAEVICSMGFLLTIVAAIIPFARVRKIIFWPICGLIRFLSALSRIGSWQTVDRTSLSVVSIGLVLAAVCLYFIWVTPAGLRRMLAGLGLILSLGSYLIPFAHGHESACQVYFLDVGQGDATLICSQDANVLIDGGNLGNGKKIVKTMENLGVSSIDVAIMSHLDIDHVGGLLELWRAGYISELYAPFWGESLDMLQLQSLCTALPEHVNLLKQGDNLVLSPDMFLRCEWPKSAESGGNSDSLVILAEIYGVRILFTGDVDESVEEKLRNRELQDIQVLKVAHHGSRFSTSEEFLYGKNIDAAVISVGYNHYGHPSNEVLNRLSQADIPFYRTDEQGCVFLQIEEDDWMIDYYFDC